MCLYFFGPSAKTVSSHCRVTQRGEGGSKCQPGRGSPCRRAGQWRFRLPSFGRRNDSGGWVPRPTPTPHGNFSNFQRQVASKRPMRDADGGPDTLGGYRGWSWNGYSIEIAVKNPSENSKKPHPPARGTCAWLPTRVFLVRRIRSYPGGSWWPGLELPLEDTVVGAESAVSTF